MRTEDTSELSALSSILSMLDDVPGRCMYMPLRFAELALRECMRLATPARFDMLAERECKRVTLAVLCSGGGLAARLRLPRLGVLEWRGRAPVGLSETVRERVLTRLSRGVRNGFSGSSCALSRR